MPSSGEVGLASASSLPRTSPLAPSVEVLAMGGRGWVAGLVARPSMDPATPVEVEEVPCASAELPVVRLPSHSKRARPRWTRSDRRWALFGAPSWLVRASASDLLCPSSCSSWGLEICFTHRRWEELRLMLTKASSFCASPSSS
jgi:hypothetical protein